MESDARDNASYKLRISRDGRTWNAVKDQAQLDAFHARATRLGATNGVAFSTKRSSSKLPQKRRRAPRVFIRDRSSSSLRS